MYKLIDKTMSVLTIAGLAATIVLSGCNQTSSADSERAVTTAASAEQSSEMTTLHFDLDGMHCEGCVSVITEAVMKVDGVKSCDVSLDNTSAVVKAANKDVVDAIITAIEEEGYKARHRADA